MSTRAFLRRTTRFPLGWRRAGRIALNDHYEPGCGVGARDDAYDERKRVRGALAEEQDGVGMNLSGRAPYRTRAGVLSASELPYHLSALRVIIDRLTSLVG